MDNNQGRRQYALRPRRGRAQEPEPEQLSEDERRLLEWGWRNVLRGRRRPHPGGIYRPFQRRRLIADIEDEDDGDEEEQAAAAAPAPADDFPSDEEVEEPAPDAPAPAAAEEEPPEPPPVPDPNNHPGATNRLGRLVAALRRMRIIHRGADGKERINVRQFNELWETTAEGVYSNDADVNEIQGYIRWIKFTNRARRNIIRYVEPAGDAPYLDIPFRGAFELSLVLFLYLLRRMGSLGRGHVYAIMSREYGDDTPAAYQGVFFIDEAGDVKLDHFNRIYFGTVSRFVEFFYDEHRPLRSSHDYWADTGGSGEVFRIVNYVNSLDPNNANPMFRFTYIFMPGFNWNVGTRWHPALKEPIERVFPRGGIVCAMNETDDLCLLYSMAMGIVCCASPNFFTRQKFIDVNVISRRINNLLLDSCLNAQEIMFRIRTRRPGDECDKLSSVTLKNLSTTEVCSALQHIEDVFLFDSFALDVYMLDISTAGGARVYPCYISRRASAKRVSILNIYFGKVSHYCTITNMSELWHVTSGKIFYTCSKCHRTYFSKQMEVQHEHCLDGSNGWNWSVADTAPNHVIAGRCEKCHLLFEDEERAAFHARHCFMKHRSGSRYVKLPKDPILHGGGDEQSLDDRYLIFADFECLILEDGTHELMSYGYYDVRADHFELGYSIERFMLHLESIVAHVPTNEIHVFFHNAMNYDVNFIIRFVLEYRPSWSISVIMKSATRLQTVRFTFGQQGKRKKIIIGDTFHFMTMSLARIVDSIRKDDIETNMRNFPHFFQVIRRREYGTSPYYANLVLRKNLYPYRFFNSPERITTYGDEFFRIFEPLEENLQYFSEGITVEDLRQNLPLFKDVCRVFHIGNSRDYHDLYLTCDVMQITDVFLKARQTLFETHHIDIAKYIGMPGASWAAFLKMNPDMELPLYRETRFAEFFSYMTRGGVTSAALRYAESDDMHSIIYLDVNGLYPYVMQQYKYPTGEMVWRTFDDVSCRYNAFLLNTYFKHLEEEGRGACLCVDLHIPDEVKEKSDQFPFAPEHRLLKDCYFDADGEMYPFLRRWSEANNGEQMKSFYGLVGTLYDKDHYGVHWKLLQWYIRHGVVVTNIHFAVEFDEGDYLKEYVSLNISIRNTRSDELGKMVYKLLGNSIYGKTFESPFNRGTFLIIRDEDKLRGLLEEGNISSITPLEGGNCIVKVDSEEVVLDKPTYIGACVTEYAKLHMYTLFYDKLGRIFKDLQLVYTDTDSFIIRVGHPRPGMTPHDLFEYIEENEPGLIGKNGGQLKSETGEDLIKEVIALRSKLYAYITESGKIGKRAKGTTAAAQEAELTWDAYKQALLELRAVPTHNMQFQRRGFKIRSVELVKQSISVNDGKRYIEEDGIHTHAWGWDHHEH